MVQTAFIPSGVARKVTVLSSAKDSTFSVSRFDSKKKGSVGSWPLSGTVKKVEAVLDPVPEPVPEPGQRQVKAQEEVRGLGGGYKQKQS